MVQRQKDRYVYELMTFRVTLFLTLLLFKIYLDTLEIGGLKADGAAIGLANNKFLKAQEQDSGIAGMGT